MTGKMSQATLDLIEALKSFIAEQDKGAEKPEVEEEEEKPAKTAVKKKSRTRKPEPEPEPEEEEEVAEPVVTLNDVRKAMKSYSAEFGESAARKLLAPYGTKTLSGLDEEDYASLMADIDEAME